MSSCMLVVADAESRGNEVVPYRLVTLRIVRQKMRCWYSERTRKRHASRCCIIVSRKDDACGKMVEVDFLKASAAYRSSASSVRISSYGVDVDYTCADLQNKIRNCSLIDRQTA